MAIDSGRLRLIIVAAVGISIVAAGTIIARTRVPDGLDQSIAVLSDDARFNTSRAAGDAFAEVADLLYHDGRRCLQAGESSLSCELRQPTSAYAHITAFTLPRCSMAGVQAARGDLLDYLRALAELRDETERTLRHPPARVRC